jgi:putative ABC transport system permease protein
MRAASDPEERGKLWEWLRARRPGGLDNACSGLYVSYKQSPSRQQAVVVRGAMDPSPLVKSIETAVRELNKPQPLAEVKPLEQSKLESLGENRRRTILLGTFAGFALLLSAIEVYGVISYSVSQRMHEIGIRAALGASPWAQVTLVLKTGLALTGARLAAGVLGALGLTRILSSMLFGVSLRDPWTLSVSVVLAAVAVAACYIPAYRGARVDPLVALRHE